MNCVFISKAKRPSSKVATYDRVHALGRRMEGAIKADLVTGLETLRRSADRDAMLEAFKGKKYDRVTEAVPWEKLGGKLQPIEDKLAKTVAQGADSARQQVPSAAGLRYSPANPKIASYLKSRTGELITTSEAGMLEAVRAATQRALTHGLTPEQVAQEIRGSIGLNAPQARALANYRNGLAAAKTKPARIDSLVDTYRNRMIDHRATMIARTEVRAALNVGQHDIWEVAQKEGLLPPGTKRIWVVDGDPCAAICLPMRNAPVELDEPWTLPDGRQVDNPTLSHPHCLCISALQFPGQ